MVVIRHENEWVIYNIDSSSWKIISIGIFVNYYKQLKNFICIHTPVNIEVWIMIPRNNSNKAKKNSRLEFFNYEEQVFIAHRQNFKFEF